jgi:hypothetical protein
LRSSITVATAVSAAFVIAMSAAPAGAAAGSAPTGTGSVADRHDRCEHFLYRRHHREECEHRGEDHKGGDDHKP